MSMSKLRLVSGLSLGLFAACGDRFEMVTVALMTDPPSTGITDDSSTEGTTSTPTGGVMTSTEGDPSGSPSPSDPTVPTTGEPVACETPEGCTGMGSGDLGPLALPFFRGKVCVSDQVRPGDLLALWVSTCVHPCMEVDGFSFDYAYRCTPDTCETALAFRHPNATGSACPPDVYGEFAAEFCAFQGPYTFTLGPVDDGKPMGALLLPFLTNDEMAEIDGGNQAGLWAMVDGHTQAEDRRIPLSFSADNPAAPGACGEGVAGCTCRDIGL